VPWWFERGLLGLSLSGLQWLIDVPPDQSAWSGVSAVEVCVLNPQDVERLAACPVLSEFNKLHLLPQLNSIGLGAAVGPEGARSLAASPHLTRLTYLALTHSAIGPDGASALAASPHLRGLAALDLSGWDWTMPNLIGDEGARALAESAHLTHLTRLDLTENDIGDVGVRALASSANMRGVTHLNLSGNLFDIEGVRALASSPYLACLTSLRAGGYGFLNGFPGSLVQAAEMLLSSPHLPNLTRLDFGYPTCGEPSAEMKGTFRQRFGDRVVWGDGQPGLHGIDR
jgi:hypothetical protein